MTARNFLYAESTGQGNEYELKEALDADHHPGTIPATTIATTAWRLIASDSNRDIVPVVVGTNELVGRTTGDIANLSRATVRSMLNVEEGATATQGQNTASADTNTNAVNVYKDTTGSPFANRMNFYTMRPKASPSALSRVSMTNTGIYNEIDILEAPHTYSIHGDNRISTGLVVPLIRAAQRMEVIEVLISVYFNNIVTNPDQRFGFRLYLCTTDNPATGTLTELVNASSYANSVAHLDAENSGYIDAIDGRWSISAPRIINSNDWLLLNISNKHLNAGSTSGADVEYINVISRFGYV